MMNRVFAISVALLALTCATLVAGSPSCGDFEQRPCSADEAPARCVSGLVENYASKRCERSSLEQIKPLPEPLPPVFARLHPDNPDHAARLAQRMTLAIAGPSGDPLAKVEVQGAQSILDLKREIAKVAKSNASSFDVYLPLTDQPLDDTLRIAQYELNEQSDLYVLAKPCRGAECKMVLLIYPRGEPSTSDHVSGNTTVLEVKEHMRNKTRRPAKHIELDFEGTVLKNDRTLASYQIGNHTSTTLGMRYTAPASITFLLYVRRPDGSILTLDEQTNYTFVDEVKAEIERVTGISASRQALSFKGQPLNQRFLGLDVPVREGDTIDLSIIPSPNS